MEALLTPTPKCEPSKSCSLFNVLFCRLSKATLALYKRSVFSTSFKTQGLTRGYMVLLTWSLLSHGKPGPLPIPLSVSRSRMMGRTDDLSGERPAARLVKAVILVMNSFACDWVNARTIVLSIITGIFEPCAIWVSIPSWKALQFTGSFGTRMLRPNPTSHRETMSFPYYLLHFVVYAVTELDVTNQTGYYKT
jgi:hypothetical protein